MYVLILWVFMAVFISLDLDLEKKLDRLSGARKQLCDDLKAADYKYYGNGTTSKITDDICDAL